MPSLMRLTGLVAAALAVALASHTTDATSLRQLEQSAHNASHGHHHHQKHHHNHQQQQHQLKGFPGQQPRSCNGPTYDTDYEGHDFKNVPGQAEHCCDLCNDEDGCYAWSWNGDNGGTCWLKSQRGKSVQKPGVVSGYVLVSAQCPFEENTDYEGNDITHKTGSDVMACCGICSLEPGCRAWSWNTDNGGTCWLKSAKGNAVFKQGVTSATM